MILTSLLVAFFFILPITTTNAIYPDKLVWHDCGSNGTTKFKCGHLEFCQDGSSNNFGYRAPLQGSSSNKDEPALCGSKPGPLIRMEKGTVYKLVLHNSASERTNLHTHGLHIVGDGDGDDITRMVEGGGGGGEGNNNNNNNCLTYTWDVSPTHPGGTHWYHPHFHGRANDQVAGGAFGMIVVEDGKEEVNEWAAHPENELILLIFSKRVERYDNDVEGQVLANGVGRELLQILPDSWYRLRISAVDPSGGSNYLNFSNSCTVYKVASDGVWHTSGSLTSYEASSFELTGASRADFALRCKVGSHTISWGGSVVATIDAHFDHDRNGGIAASGDDAVDLGVAPEHYLGDLSSALVPESNKFTIGSKKDAIRYNGSEYYGMSGLGNLAYDQVYEMRITDSNRHPFHLHLYHMQIVTPGGCGMGHIQGEYYDTISAPKDTICTVRFKTANIGQKMVLHCHELEHEDDGAINFFNVIGVPESRRNEVDSPSYKCPVEISYDGSEYPDNTTGENNMNKAECNVSFCKVTSDCCSDTCLPFGRCGNPEDLKYNDGHRMMNQVLYNIMVIAAIWILLV